MHIEMSRQHFGIILQGHSKLRVLFQNSPRKMNEEKWERAFNEAFDVFRSEEFHSVTMIRPEDGHSFAQQSGIIEKFKKIVKFVIEILMRELKIVEGESKEGKCEKRRLIPDALDKFSVVI